MTDPPLTPAQSEIVMQIVERLSGGASIGFLKLEDTDCTAADCHAIARSVSRIRGGMFFVYHEADDRFYVNDHGCWPINVFPIWKPTPRSL